MTTTEQEISAGLRKPGGFEFHRGLDLFGSVGARRLDALQQSYFDLPPDRSDAGLKRRTYFRYTAAIDGTLSESGAKSYTNNSNERRLAPTSARARHGALYQQILCSDVAYAAEHVPSFAGRSLEIGAHQIRYAPIGINPSYSYPPLFHKDDERLVFVHLVGRSTNLVGGLNWISNDGARVDSVVSLEQPLDTLVLDRSVFHLVTPMLSAEGGQLRAYRDVLLVTVDLGFVKVPDLG